MNFDTHELAWAAGFYDGEGSTSQGRSRRETGTYLCARVSITQLDREALERFRAAVLGLGKITPKEVGGKAGWCWHAHADGAVAVIALLWKFLGRIKRDQAHRVLIEWQDYRRSRPDWRDRTHCKHGHSLAEHGYIYQGKTQQNWICRICTREKDARSRAKRYAKDQFREALGKVG